MNIDILQRINIVVPCVAIAAALSAACGGYSDEPAPGSASSEITVSTDFTLAIQVAETNGNLAGAEASTPEYESGGGTSLWACDSDCFDPDSARLELTGFTQDDVKGRDFRVCLQASDGRTAHSQQGTPACTNWASLGSSSTGLATDSDGFDPDSYRVSLLTRPWPNNVDQAREVKFRIRAWDKGGGSVYQIGAWSSYTGTNTQGGGLTTWTSGPLVRDPDGFEIEMNVAQTSIGSFCTSTHRCEHGFGDCDTNLDCVSGTTCVQDVGASFGYADPTLDVCVD